MYGVNEQQIQDIFLKEIKRVYFQLCVERPEVEFVSKYNKLGFWDKALNTQKAQWAADEDEIFIRETKRQSGNPFYWEYSDDEDADRFYCYFNSGLYIGKYKSCRQGTAVYLSDGTSHLVRYGSGVEERDVVEAYGQEIVNGLTRDFLNYDN